MEKRAIFKVNNWAKLKSIIGPSWVRLKKRPTWPNYWLWKFACAFFFLSKICWNPYFYVFFWHSLFLKKQTWPNYWLCKPPNLAQLLTSQHIYVYVYIYITSNHEEGIHLQRNQNKTGGVSRYFQKHGGQGSMWLSWSSPSRGSKPVTAIQWRPAAHPWKWNRFNFESSVILHKCLQDLPLTDATLGRRVAKLQGEIHVECKLSQARSRNYR